jgi:hypothetical protein
MRNASHRPSIRAANHLQVLRTIKLQTLRQLADRSTHEGHRQSGHYDKVVVELPDLREPLHDQTVPEPAVLGADVAQQTSIA